MQHSGQIFSRLNCSMSSQQQVAEKERRMLDTLDKNLQNISYKRWKKAENNKNDDKSSKCVYTAALIFLGETSLWL